MAEDKKNPKEASNIFHSIMKASVSKPATKNKTYTEAELVKAIKYACEYQKAVDYQTAGKLLIVEDNELKRNSALLLDELADENNASAEIQLKDIFE